MKNKILIILVIVFLAATLCVNALANILPINNKTTAVLSDAIVNLFVPAGITFSIWGIIYLLLLLFTVYQAVPLFRKTEEPHFMARTRIYFVISCIFNICWIFAWHYEQILLSFFIMLGLLAVLILQYLTIDANKKEFSLIKKTSISLPFSVYLGWITVATIANATALLVTAGWDRFGLSESFWTVTVIAAAAIIGVITILIKKDIAFNLVLVWTFTGILIKRLNPAFPPQPEIVAASILSIALLSAGIVITAAAKIFRYISNNKAQTA